MLFINVQVKWYLYENNPEYLEMVQKAENVVDITSTTFGIKVIDNLSEEELSEVRYIF